MTSVWSQPFGGNPLGLEDALVLLYFTADLFYSSAPLPLRPVAYNRGCRLMVIDWQFDFEITLKHPLHATPQMDRETLVLLGVIPSYKIFVLIVK